MEHQSKQYERVKKALAKAEKIETKKLTKEQCAVIEHDTPRKVRPATNAILARAGAGFDLTHLGNSDRFLAKYGTRTAFAIGAGWVVFDGYCWDRYSGNERAKGMAGEIARAIKEECKFLKKKQVPYRLQWAASSGRASAINGSLDVMKPAVMVSLDVFDRQPHLWNAQNGTLDLTTGQLAQFSPADMLTGMGPVDYDPKAPCPAWDAFITDITCGDGTLAGFLQRAVGYSMFAHQEEQVAFFLTGDETNDKMNGSNGKSLFLAIMAAVFGQYQTGVDKGLITQASRKSGINSDVAALSGKRLGIGGEFDRNDVMDEREFKRLTGDDVIKARFLRQEYFDFYSKATLWYATNYMPLIQSQDAGVYRRTIIIPFLAKFHDAHECPEGGKVKDPKLKARLLEELEGIFRWCVEGAVAYAQGGLNVPGHLYAVRNAKKGDFNPLSDFVSMCLDISPDKVEPASDLFRAYERFAEVNEGEKLPWAKFGRRLNGMGIVKDADLSKRRIHRRGAGLNETGKAYLDGTRGLIELENKDRAEHLRVV
ncbi:phage/plasmid primase, P4 family [Sagittula sp. MA-2]|jgi:putative DNA primase/helicase|uniref:DNA primase family protein n=1 Tax=Sagittula sp. MA-2 TaxID=3048007 RepID=UPI0024C3AF14|nr:phage/plasmid primase, P4 family [Sagittula sp. MA-2]WHZ37335.1 phage/plasmid primase, P4 family [Sagittula sp. MA-2]